MKYLPLLLCLAACAPAGGPDAAGSLEGTWLLVYSSKADQDFWTNPNQVPLGFRIYRNDSAEVYRNKYDIFRERFTPIRTAAGQLEIFESDSLGWWKRSYSLQKDQLYINDGKDTLRYQRLFKNESYLRHNFDKIILTSGGGWGELLSAAVYPDGKTLVYTPVGRTDPRSTFCILQAPKLIPRLAESVYWIKRIQEHEAYDEFRYQFDNGIVTDGAFSEMLFLSRDSVFLAERGQQYSHQNHLLGLQGYAFSKILKKKFLHPKDWASIPSMCDSTRVCRFPPCSLTGIVNHLSISMLIAESMNRPLPNSKITNRHLNFVFRAKCAPDQFMIETDGRIVSSGNKFYDTGYDFLQILKKY